MEDISVDTIEKLIKERTQAKKDGKQQLVYQIEYKLRGAGILIYDTPEGTRWRELD